MNHFWTVAILIVAGIFALARSAHDYGKDGQKEYESAEREARLMKKARSCNEEHESSPEPSQQETQAKDDGFQNSDSDEPFIDVSEKSKPWETILDIPTTGGWCLQVSFADRRLCLNHWRRDKFFDYFELPGNFRAVTAYGQIPNPSGLPSLLCCANSIPTGIPLKWSGSGNRPMT